MNLHCPSVIAHWLVVRLLALGLSQIDTAMASRAAVAALIMLLTGCASLPNHVQRPASMARADVADTRLARIAAASTPPENVHLSGLRLLAEANQAFDARIALARAAQQTLDAQYYLITFDSSGLQFLHELRDAAERGVRVRLLVDDLHTAGQDALFASLAARNNVEVRLFNPLPVRDGSLASRVAFSIHEFTRINRRMHNKLFIADNSFAITGGRNIADEYFGRAAPANFIDMDLLSSGPTVRELSAVFDTYWNSEYVYPIDSLVAQRVGAKLFDDWVNPAGPAIAFESTSVAAQLEAGHIELQFGRVQVLADLPNKVDDRSGADGVSMRGNLELIRAARSEVLIASPYFVPGKNGLAALKEAVGYNARLSVITNSLATTDEPLVHFGYARYRSALIKLGAALYELMPGAERGHDAASRSSGSFGRLHAKLAVVDRRWLYVGSMNMDRRSAHCNTELGVIIDSPEIAGAMADSLQRELLARNYKLRVAPESSRIEWVAGTDERQVVQGTEPEISAWRDLWLRMTLSVVGEELL